MSAVYNSTTQIVDDNSPDIAYSPSSAWTLGGTDNEYDGSTHGFVGTNTEKGTASFQFEGSAVEVHGTVGPADGAPIATYQIDNTTPVSIGTSPEANTTYNVLFYSSSNLDPTTLHTLVITPIGAADSRYWLDYILFTPPSAANALSSASAAPPNSVVPLPSVISPSADPQSSRNSAPSSVLTAFSTPARTVSQPDATASGSIPTPTPVPSMRNIGAIVGGAVGGFVGLAILFALLYFFRLRRRFQRYYWSKKEIGDMLGPELPSPVQYPKQYSDRDIRSLPLSASSIRLMSVVEGQSGDTVSQVSYGSRLAPDPPVSRSSSPSDDTRLQESGVPVPFTLSQHLAGATTNKRGRLLPEPPMTYHSDGGIRLAYNDEVFSSKHDPPLRVVDIPPAYGRY
ncbi:hypothetical protein BV25DRAFT_1823207 [Artomyces pyxidatus]|uniref:Uncharacterized protein n=1 Tax=Artomyces pyxidatus TaxID=48021 RepID=A0ACB8T6Y8_9AGAM|nr:hypothetical protein BV25DRAFT_1823207 [Artomyces pyxidatus]